MKNETEPGNILELYTIPHWQLTSRETHALPEKLHAKENARFGGETVKTEFKAAFPGSDEIADFTYSTLTRYGIILMEDVK